ncbi:hypothetical protein ACE2AJ_09865 [Aquihabitans daechungensis]|uniref:hypothetical protein n=1 Tax=Aquihabitans daechungensis TaxID=1052257 RepID=UPI003BA25BA8
MTTVSGASVAARPLRWTGRARNTAGRTPGLAADDEILETPGKIALSAPAREGLSGHGHPGRGLPIVRVGLVLVLVICRCIVPTRLAAAQERGGDPESGDHDLLQVVDDRDDEPAGERKRSEAPGEEPDGSGERERDCPEGAHAEQGLEDDEPDRHPGVHGEQEVVPVVELAALPLGVLQNLGVGRRVERELPRRRSVEAAADGLAPPQRASAVLVGGRGPAVPADAVGDHGRHREHGRPDDQPLPEGTLRSRIHLRLARCLLRLEDPERTDAEHLGQGEGSDDGEEHEHHGGCRSLVRIGVCASEGEGLELQGLLHDPHPRGGADPDDHERRDHLVADVEVAHVLATPALQGPAPAPLAPDDGSGRQLQQHADAAHQVLSRGRSAAVGED